jgi:phage shock protein A
MGIFSRFKDIVSANLNAMLDKAEDPEKMIRLMIQEMEETLLELKSSCAGSMADRKMAEREIESLEKEGAKWQERAELAVSKGREDLAKEALMEKSRFQNRSESLNGDIGEYDRMIKQSRKEIDQLEEKLNAAREKQQVLLKRRLRADQSLKTRKKIRKAGSADTMRRFEEFEYKIDRLEAEAGLVNPSRSSGNESLEDKFNRLAHEDTIERELQELKKASGK